MGSFVYDPPLSDENAPTAATRRIIPQGRQCIIPEKILENKEVKIFKIKGK
jgi:hypothetical protein